MGQKPANNCLYIYLGMFFLKPIGAKVGCQQLYKILEFIERICPWFPEQGNMNADMRGVLELKYSHSMMYMVQRTFQ